MKAILWIIAAYGAYKIWQFLYILFYSVYGDHALGDELKKCVELTLADSSAQSKEDKLKVLTRACFCYEDWYYGIDDKEETNTALWLAFEFKSMLEEDEDA